MTTGNPDPNLLETKYRTAALTLAELPEHPELEPDFHPWEPGGRLWRAGKFALIALRLKHNRLGGAELTHDERAALEKYAEYEAGDPGAFATQAPLNEARYLALRALLAEHDTNTKS